MSFPLPITPENVGIMAALGFIGNPSPPVPPDPQVPAQWWTPGVYHQSDPINGRYVVNGVEYASVAAMVTAGVATNVTGGGYSVLLPANTQVSIVADAVASSSTPTVTEFMFGLDGVGAAASTDFVYVGRTTTNLTQSGITAAGVSVTTLALGAGAASAAVRVSARYKSTAYVASRDGANGVTNTGAAYPIIGRVTIGNRYDGIRPWNGTINGVSIFITREFTKEQCELMAGVGLLRRMGWSWWNKQQALTRSGKTYMVAYNGADLMQYVICMDEASRKVIDFAAVTAPGTIPKDDHSSGGVDFLSNARLIAGTAGHDDEQFVRFRRSTNDMPGNFEAEVQISHPTEDISYAQLFVNGTDVFCVCQTGGNDYWDIFKSIDSGATWTRLKRLVHGTTTGGTGPNQWYLASSDNNSGIVTYYTQQHPGNEGNAIRRFSLNLNTGDLSISGVVVGSIYAGTNDVAITEISACELIRQAATGHCQRLLSVSGDGAQLGIADTPDGVLWTNASTLFGWESEGSWTFNTITNASQFSPTNNPSYIAGMDIAREPHTGFRGYVSRNNGTAWVDERWDSPDGAAWTPTVLKNNGAVINMRPVCPRGATAALAMIGQFGTHPDFNTWTLDAQVLPAS